MPYNKAALELPTSNQPPNQTNQRYALVPLDLTIHEALPTCLWNHSHTLGCLALFILLTKSLLMLYKEKGVSQLKKKKATHSSRKTTCNLAQPSLLVLLLSFFHRCKRFALAQLISVAIFSPLNLTESIGLALLVAFCCFPRHLVLPLFHKIKTSQNTPCKQRKCHPMSHTARVSLGASSSNVAPAGVISFFGGACDLG